MEPDHYTTIWNYSAVKVLDIRHRVMEAEELLVDYRLPANCFLYFIRGSGTVEVDEVVYAIESFYLLHGAKGKQLHIKAADSLEYYLLFYRTQLVFTRWKEVPRLLAQHNPFTIMYGFQPIEPLSLHSCLQIMKHAWDEAGKLGKLQSTGLFYQFIHELLWQMKANEQQIEKTDFVTSAVRYIDHHYQQNITLQSLADQLNYSVRHLAVSFKQQVGVSPIEYLTRTRVRHACDLLVGTDASLKEIAEYVGYADVYYFSRVFKKQVGLSPVRYQADRRNNNRSPNRPSFLSELYIGMRGPDRHTKVDNDNHYHIKQYSGGSDTMNRNTKSAMLLSMLISVTMLLSACMTGGSSNTNSSTTIPPSSAPTAVVETTSTVQATTKIVRTEKGDIEVPLNPERVVVMYLIGDAAALGVTPVGISEMYAGAAFSEQLASADSLGPEYEVNPEAVMAMDPDLIIVATEFTYDKLQAIAPTVYVPYDKMTTEERITMLGEVFSKEEEAKKVLDQFNQQVATSKQQLQEAGVLDKTVTIMEGGAKEMFVVESTSFGRGSQIVYDYLGMKAPDAIQKNMNVSETQAGKSVSMEVLPEFVGDYVVRSAWEGMDDLSTNKIWSSLDAVKKERVIEAEFGLFFYTDPISLSKQLDLLTEKLLEGANK